MLGVTIPALIQMCVLYQFNLGRYNYVVIRNVILITIGMTLHFLTDIFVICRHNRLSFTLFLGIIAFIIGTTTSIIDIERYIRTGETE